MCDRESNSISQGVVKSDELPSSTCALTGTNCHEFHGVKDAEPMSNVHGDPSMSTSFGFKFPGFFSYGFDAPKRYSMVTGTEQNGTDDIEIALEASMKLNDEQPSTPRLPILSNPMWELRSEPQGMKTPPLRDFCSVPFKWEEIPGKAKPTAEFALHEDSAEGQHNCNEDLQVALDEAVQLAVLGFDVDRFPNAADMSKRTAGEKMRRLLGLWRFKGFSMQRKRMNRMKKLYQEPSSLTSSMAPKGRTCMFCKNGATAANGQHSILSSSSENAILVENDDIARKHGIQQKQISVFRVNGGVEVNGKMLGFCAPSWSSSTRLAEDYSHGVNPMPTRRRRRKWILRKLRRSSTLIFVKCVEERLQIMKNWKLTVDGCMQAAIWRRLRSSDFYWEMPKSWKQYE
eukprot:Gb_09579 [translate_table: standard]